MDESKSLRRRPSVLINKSIVSDAEHKCSPPLDTYPEPTPLSKVKMLTKSHSLEWMPEEVSMLVDCLFDDVHIESVDVDFDISLEPSGLESLLFFEDDELMAVA